MLPTESPSSSGSTTVAGRALDAASCCPAEPSRQSPASEPVSSGCRTRCSRPTTRRTYLVRLMKRPAERVETPRRVGTNGFKGRLLAPDRACCSLRPIPPPGGVSLRKPTDESEPRVTHVLTPSHVVRGGRHWSRRIRACARHRDRRAGGQRPGSLGDGLARHRPVPRRRVLALALRRGRRRRCRGHL